MAQPSGHRRANGLDDRPFGPATGIRFYEAYDIQVVVASAHPRLGGVDLLAKTAHTASGGRCARRWGGFMVTGRVRTARAACRAERFSLVSGHAKITQYGKRNFTHLSF